MCFYIVSCRYIDYAFFEIQTETDITAIFNEASLVEDSVADKSLFGMSLSNIGPMLTQKQILQPYWQKLSFADHQLNIIEGVFLSDVGVLLNDFATWPNNDYTVRLRINNNTDNTLYYAVPIAPPSVRLEKIIDGEWYEAPLFGGAHAYLKSHPPVRLQLDTNESEFYTSVNLNYWRPSAEGLYRIVMDVSLDSDSERSYFLSENFEIRMGDYKTRFSEDQINSLEGISLTLFEYDYKEDRWPCIIKNESEFVIYYGLLWELEEYRDGYWYEVPTNTITPSGSGDQGGAFAVGYTLQSGQEFMPDIRMQNWHPLSIGLYRVMLILSVEDGTPFPEREIFPIGAVFEIVK